MSGATVYRRVWVSFAIAMGSENRRSALKASAVWRALCHGALHGAASVTPETGTVRPPSYVAMSRSTSSTSACWKCGPTLILGAKKNLPTGPGGKETDICAFETKPSLSDELLSRLP
jgi:hypothetical protein